MKNTNDSEVNPEHMLEIFPNDLVTKKQL